MVEESSEHHLGVILFDAKAPAVIVLVNAFHVFAAGELVTTGLLQFPAGIVGR